MRIPGYRIISERFKEALDESGVKEEDILFIEVGHETDSNGNVGVWYVEIAECWDDEDLESDDPNDEGYGIDQTGSSGFSTGQFAWISGRFPV